jgi:hypothetical protein
MRCQHSYPAQPGAAAYLLLEPIQLDDTRISLQNLDLEAFCRSTPLRAADVALIEGEGLTAACRFPSETCFGKSALAALFG